MFSLFKNTLQDFKHTYKQHLLFTLIYLLLSSVLFVPILSYIYDRMLRFMGTSVLVNRDVYKIALSYTGIFGMSLICLCSVIILFIEFGVIIVISQKKIFHQRILIVDAIHTTLNKLPKIFGFGFLHLMFLLFVLLPFIESPLFTPLRESVNIPILIGHLLQVSKLSFVLYIIVLLLIVYIVLRWIFTLHFMIIEDQSILEAVRSSLQLTRNNRFRMIVYLFIFNLLMFSVFFLFVSLFSLLPSVFIEQFLIPISSYLTVILSLFLIPLNMIFLTRLFYDLKQKKGMEIVDPLRLVNSFPIFRQTEKQVFEFIGTNRYFVMAVLAIYITGLFLLNYSISDNIIYVRWNVHVAAHRGDAIHAPENSLSAIQLAMEKGVDAVEIDVQLTKDGVLVLNHDANLKRVAKVPYRVADLSYQELAEIDIGIDHAEEFQGEKIPTLEQVFQLTGDQVKLLIDLKSFGAKGELARKVVELIEQYALVHSVYVQSFHMDILQEIRQLNPEIRIGQIIQFATGDLSTHDVDFYTINQRMLSEKFVRHARQHHREIWVWTVNFERNIKEVLKYPIDGIITDYPEKVQRMLALNVEKME